MTDIDDFELINDPVLSNEQTFEFIDVNDGTEKNTNINKPTTSSIIVPPLVSKPLVNEIPQVVQQQQQQQTSNPTVNSSESKVPVSPIKTMTPITPLVQIQKTVPSPTPTPPPRPIIIAPVPQLPKAPAPKRYGDAALIPHNIDETIDIDVIINKSKKTHQNTLNVSIQQQQQSDIQTTFENMASGSAFSNVLKAKEDLQKSPEQLEREKRSILSQRVPALDLDGKTKEDLIEKAKQFHNLLQQLHGAIYELSERFERQKYDMVELGERARQIEKGKAKTRKSNIVHTGLGGGLFSGVNDITAQAPAKVSLFSRYERLTDRRTFKDRRDVWATEKKSNDFVPERPKAKIKHKSPPADKGLPRKTKRASTKNEELPPPSAEETEAPEQEEPPAEEQSAPEEEQNEEAAAEEGEEEEE
ncbi:unnamed protein product [Rotaria sordida]|uniref:Uncharacterized protein n=1 Tax=Rotaria sordida TaxID=392033 RepID=A0A813QJT1_9BILA|nr:unnamed protein product [Rotaria sordida]